MSSSKSIFHFHAAVFIVFRRFYRHPLRLVQRFFLPVYILQANQPAIIFGALVCLYEAAGVGGVDWFSFKIAHSEWKTLDLWASGEPNMKKRTNPRSVRKGRGLSGKPRALSGWHVHYVPPQRRLSMMWLGYLIKSSVIIGCLCCLLLFFCFFYSHCISHLGYLKKTKQNSGSRGRVVLLTSKSF